MNEKEIRELGEKMSKRGVRKKCVVCHKGYYGLFDATYQFSAIESATSTPTEANTITTVACVCSNCGHVSLFSNAVY